MCLHSHDWLSRLIITVKSHLFTLVLFAMVRRHLRYKRTSKFISQEFYLLTTFSSKVLKLNFKYLMSYVPCRNINRFWQIIRQYQNILTDVLLRVSMSIFLDENYNFLYFRLIRRSDWWRVFITFLQYVIDKKKWNWVIIPWELNILKISISQIFLSTFQLEILMFSLSISRYKKSSFWCSILKPPIRILWWCQKRYETFDVPAGW